MKVGEVWKRKDNPTKIKLISYLGDDEWRVQRWVMPFMGAKEEDLIIAGDGYTMNGKVIFEEYFKDYDESR